MLEELKTFLTDPIEIETAKTKSVEVLTGTAKFKLEIQESAFNQNARAKYERHITKKRQKIARGLFAQGKDKLLDEMGISPDELVIIEDSIPLDVAITQQFTDISIFTSGGQNFRAGSTSGGYSRIAIYGITNS